jgi:phage repressor protein C with HTH and peptisase S24 domain
MNYKDQLRELLKAYTQVEVADYLGITDRTIQNYLDEEKPTKPHQKTIRNIGELYTKVIKEGIKINPQTGELSLSGQAPKVVVLPAEAPAGSGFLKERMEHKMTISTLMVPLVPIKAQAGYITSHELFDFIDKLERFPMAPGINPRGAEWRWFEVSGESMEPTLYEGDYILCSMVNQEDWRNLENYYMYCIVTTGNMWVKRIVKKDGQIFMYSDNKKVKPREITFEEIREIWKVRRHLNARIPPPEKIQL